MPEYSDYIESLTPVSVLDGSEILGASQGGNARRFTVKDVLNGTASANPVVECGNVDLSSDNFPTTGGTGAGGAIKKGNSFYVTVAGSPGGFFIDVGAEIKAKVDTPGQTISNWRIIL